MKKLTFWQKLFGVIGVAAFIACILGYYHQAAIGCICFIMCWVISISKKEMKQYKNKIAKCSVLDDYLLDKKTLWSINHDIEIVGYPVEIYAQDMKEETRSNQGVFSLTKNKWLTFPKQIEVNYDDPYLLKKINHYKHIMDQFMNSKCDDVIKMKKFKAKFKSMRQAAIDHGGEFSLENLIFKELRNRGYLDKFTDYIHNIEDHQLTYK